MQPSLDYLVNKANPYPVAKADWLGKIATLRNNEVYVYYGKALAASLEQKQRAIFNGCPEDDGEMREREQLIGEIRGMKALEWLLTTEVVDIQQQLKEPTNENPDDNGE